MSPLALSALAWGGGGVAGAAIAKEHRIAGGIFGALWFGVLSDAVIERKQAGLPVVNLGLAAGIGLGALALWAIGSPGKR